MAEVICSRAMTPTPDLSDWLTHTEACAALGGVSERTLYRWSTPGRNGEPPVIQKAMRRRPGQQSVAVFHPGDVARQASLQHQAKGKPFILPPDDGRSSAVSQLHSELTGPAAVGPLSDAAVTFLTLVGKVADRMFPPRFLTGEQAVRYTGLSAGYLDRLVREDRLRRIEEGMRGFRYRKADLDSL